MTFVPTKPPYPMLARPGRLEQLATAEQDGFLIEPKLDGVRCLLVAQGDTIQLFNRTLREITARFPDIVGTVGRAVLPATSMMGRLVLDGEITCNDASGLPDFQLVQHRANRLLNIPEAANTYPATYTAFDCLSSGKVNYMTQPLYMRRRILEEICPAFVAPTYTQAEANAAIAAQTGEGLMLKHKGSRYDPGARSPSWLKIKWLNEIEVVVGGVTWGIGKREPYFGGLLCGIPRPEDHQGIARLTYVGTVGTGFDDNTLDYLTAAFARIRNPTNPFVEKAPDWDVQYFVAPLVKIKVRFANYTTAGQMRFPRYVGLLD